MLRRRWRTPVSRADRNDTARPGPSSPEPVASQSADEQAKAWGGRFSCGADARLETFSASIHFDQRLWPQEIRGSLAHARMLCRQGILTTAELQQLESALGRIESELRAGEFRFDPAAEDLHMNIERRLY